MLQHEPTSAEQSSSPAQNRVTPEELTKALAALEARGEEQAKTIAIGEAVDQLNLQATPEAIWAEVQAQRQQAALGTATRLPGKTRRRLWLVLGVGSTILFGMNFAFQSMHQSTTPDAPAIEQATQVNITPLAPQTVVETLAEVKNNETFYCDETTADELMLGHQHAPSTVLVTAGRPSTGPQPATSWTFTRHDNSLYLHGYTAPRSPGAMRQGNIPVYAGSVDQTVIGGLNYSQSITLRVGGFQLKGFGGDDAGTAYVTVTGIHPDSHFKDSW